MSYFESENKLSQKTLDFERASKSLREELEAVDYYQERIDVTNNKNLKKILEHNRDEEKEHAAMLIEWMRREDKIFAKELKNYLFTEKEIKH